LPCKEADPQVGGSSTVEAASEVVVISDGEANDDEEESSLTASSCGGPSLSSYDGPPLSAAEEAALADALFGDGEHNPVVEPMYYVRGYGSLVCCFDGVFFVDFVPTSYELSSQCCTNAINIS